MRAANAALEDRSAVPSLGIVLMLALFMGACERFDRPTWSAPADAAPPPNAQVVATPVVVYYCPDGAEQCPDGYECTEAEVCATLEWTARQSACEAMVAPIATSPAFTTRGVCRGAVRTVCSATSAEVSFVDPTVQDAACQGVEGFEPQELTWDCIDNDCDGEVDEGLTPDPSFDFASGVCRGAAVEKTCRAGEVTEPDPADLTIADFEQDELTWDCLDNDCDGRVDEGLDAPDCYEGDPPDAFGDPDDPQATTVCRKGVQQCDPATGQIACVGQVSPGPEEICGNGLDDDCDGTADQPCLGGPCNRDRDCPNALTVGGFVFASRCDAGFEDGMCVLDCRCIDCNTCRLVTPGQCEETCELCEQAEEICEREIGGICGSFPRPSDGDPISACVSRCSLDPEAAPGADACRGGFDCRQAALGGRAVEACYPDE